MPVQRNSPATLPSACPSLWGAAASAIREALPLPLLANRMKFRGASLLAMVPLLILLLTMPYSASAQVIGGSGSGQSVPAAATKADLDAGPVGDNVNLFTGNLSLSYSFGNVATLSGLTFPLELQYTGNVLQGLDPVQNSGIPYGEGWALSNAAITVDGYPWDFT